MQKKGIERKKLMKNELKKISIKLKNDLDDFLNKNTDEREKEMESLEFDEKEMLKKIDMKFKKFNLDENHIKDLKKNINENNFSEELERKQIKKKQKTKK